MATLQVCDLCNASPKIDLCKIEMMGKIQLHNGKLPPPPEGFKYKEEEDSAGKKYMAMWDHLGRPLGTVQFMDKPKKFNKIKVGYDLCETCFHKFIMFFESLRNKYQLQIKEIERLDGGNKFWTLPNSFLNYGDDDEE